MTRDFRLRMAEKFLSLKEFKKILLQYLSTAEHRHQNSTTCDLKAQVHGQVKKSGEAASCVAINYKVRSAIPEIPAQLH